MSMVHVKKRVFACGLLALMVALLVALPVEAAGQRVADDAGLLTDTQRANLNALALEWQEKTGVDFAIVTTNGLGGLNQYDFAVQFYELYGGEDILNQNGGVILIVDMVGREVYLMGTGPVERYFNRSSRVEGIADEVQAQLARGNYYEAGRVFLNQSGAYVQARLNPWAARLGLVFILKCLGVGLLAAAVVVGIMLLLHKSSLPKAPPATSYFGSEGVAVTHVVDQFTGTHTSRRPVPKNTGSGGGGGGGGSFSGSSSSGRSFSGTSRKF